MVSWPLGRSSTLLVVVLFTAGLGGSFFFPGRWQFLVLYASGAMFMAVVSFANYRAMGLQLRESWFGWAMLLVCTTATVLLLMASEHQQETVRLVANLLIFLGTGVQAVRGRSRLRAAAKNTQAQKPH